MTQPRLDVLSSATFARFPMIPRGASLAFAVLVDCVTKVTSLLIGCKTKGTLCKDRILT